MDQTEVLIVGAGPVGLTLSLDLGRRGVNCILVERRPQLGFLPKMERCNARTMEFYRRLEIAEKIRSAGYPTHLPMDVFIVTSLVEEPLVHHPYPSVNELKQRIRETNDGSLPLEPYQLVSQYTLEPLLKAAAEEVPGVDVRMGCELIGFVEESGAVTATVRYANGSTGTIAARYLVGCDGGGSTVREQLGFTLEGDSNLLQLRQALFRSEDLYEQIPIGRGRHYHVADDKSTFLIVQDDCRHFTLHAEAGSDAEMEELFRKAVGFDVDYELLYVGSWTMRLMVADRYATDRVFIAGDAAHLVIPTGGLGMNTGAGDAIDLSWKLAATLQGWGGPALLKSYEAERRQVGIRNVDASRQAHRGRREWRSAYSPEIAEKSDAGARARAELSAVADVTQRKSNDLNGIELGYRYTASPLIWDDGSAAPDPNSFTYVPTTHPGARLPHLWLDDGSALHDLVGSGYTLLRFAPSKEDCSGLEAAFSEIGAPFEVLDVTSSRAREVYGFDLLLLRPDLHVVWRSNSPPDDPEAIASRATGHGPGVGT